MRQDSRVQILFLRVFRLQVPCYLASQGENDPREVLRHREKQIGMRYVADVKVFCATNLHWTESQSGWIAFAEKNLSKAISNELKMLIHMSGRTRAVD